MWQEILALSAVAAAVAYLGWSIFRVIVPSKTNPKSLCSGCPAASKGSCGVKSNSFI